MFIDVCMVGEWYDVVGGGELCCVVWVVEYVDVFVM